MKWLKKIIKPFIVISLFSYLKMLHEDSEIEGIYELFIHVLIGGMLITVHLPFDADQIKCRKDA